MLLQMLTKPRLTELVREVDTTTQLDEDVEELLLHIIGWNCNQSWWVRSKNKHKKREHKRGKSQRTAKAKVSFGLRGQIKQRLRELITDEVIDAAISYKIDEIEIPAEPLTYLERVKTFFGGHARSSAA